MTYGRCAPERSCPKGERRRRLGRVLVPAEVRHNIIRLHVNVPKGCCAASYARGHREAFALTPEDLAPQDIVGHRRPPGGSTAPGTVGYRRPPASSEPPYLHSRRTHPRSGVRRRHQPIMIPQTLSEVTGPAFALDHPRHIDLTRVESGHALGERIVVSGRVLDEDGRPARHTVVEIWQANAAGRYRHKIDQHDAPLDPHFIGCAHAVTDESGGYRFITIKPGAYPWNNHPNAWRPAHIHFSVFGPAFATRLVTQMYFPGYPLLDYDPVYNSIPDPGARSRLISASTSPPPSRPKRSATISTSCSAARSRLQWSVE